MLKIIALRHRWRLWVALGIGLLIFIQLLAFSPTRLERDLPPPAITEQKILEEVKETKPEQTASEAVPQLRIPEDQVPEYSVEGFQFVSIQDGVKQWRIEAEHAYFYPTAGFVHTVNVKAQIYDTNKKVTHVSAGQAKYELQTRDLELFTDVTASFPDGLKTLSPYLKYVAKTREVKVPPQAPIEGTSPADSTHEELFFSSLGLDFQIDSREVRLLDRVRVEARKNVPGRGREVTTIRSDHALVDRNRGVATFTMRDLPQGQVQFIEITQPDMVARSRRAEFNFGGSQRQLRNVRAYEEVKIQETPKKDPDYATDPRARAPKPRLATAGFAEFDSLRNVIVLKDFPQVYQDRDTITGEVIVVHRSSDLVEVEQSNAFTTDTKPES